ncbi:uncharacterized protein LOC120681569 [Panicum virgatum]|uniref:uncharacterized protein LOC120681569 n=1 Tax=Panicum virgatum TaxID=38727 RepID=UPI0019D52C5D|nr:uncharacterized protein LOC120681569 [Panicum virgatum]
MLPRSRALGSAARRLGLVAAPAPARASSASAARRPCPPSDGDEAGEDELLRPPHGQPLEERRWPRRGEQQHRVMLQPIVEAPSIINKTTRTYGAEANPTTLLLPRNTIWFVDQTHPIGRWLGAPKTPRGHARYCPTGHGNRPTTPATWESDGPDPATARPIQRRRRRPREHAPAAARAAETPKFPARKQLPSP